MGTESLCIGNCMNCVCVWRGERMPEEEFRVARAFQNRQCINWVDVNCSYLRIKVVCVIISLLKG